MLPPGSKSPALAAVLLLTFVLTWQGLGGEVNPPRLPSLLSALRLQDSPVVLGSRGQGGGSGSSSGGSSSPSLLQQPSAATAAEACSPEFRRASAAAVAAGSALPAALGFACKGVPRGDPKPAQAERLLQALRKRGPAVQDLFEFVPCDLLRALRGRMLWLLGDSQQAHFYQALVCFLSQFVVVDSSGQLQRHQDALQGLLSSAAIGHTGGSSGSSGGAAAGANSSSSSSCTGASSGTLQCQLGLLSQIPRAERLCTRLEGGTALCHLRVRYGGGALVSLLGSLSALGALRRSDWVLANVGLWYHREDAQRYRSDLQQVAGYYSQHRGQLPRLVWHSTSPQHFDSPGGEFNKQLAQNLGLNRCVPLKGVKLLPGGELRVKAGAGAGGAADEAGAAAELAAGGWRNGIARPLVQTAGGLYLDTYNESVPLHFMHQGGECTHFTAPVLGLWAWQLWLLLRRQAPEPSGGGGSAGSAAETAM